MSTQRYTGPFSYSSFKHPRLEHPQQPERRVCTTEPELKPTKLSSQDSVQATLRNEINRLRITALSLQLLSHLTASRQERMHLANKQLNLNASSAQRNKGQLRQPPQHQPYNQRLKAKMKRRQDRVVSPVGKQESTAPNHTRTAYRREGNYSNFHLRIAAIYLELLPSNAAIASLLDNKRCTTKPLPHFPL